MLIKDFPLADNHVPCSQISLSSSRTTLYYKDIINNNIISQGKDFDIGHVVDFSV